jgi:hypothetical protein
MSYAAGTSPYAATSALLTTTIGTSQTRIYEIGPITSISTNKFLLMASASFTGTGKTVELTVGRATTTGAANTASTNIVSQLDSSSNPLVLPVTSPAYYMAAWPDMNDSNGNPVNINGFAIDAPGTGTFYYTVWMYAGTSHNFTDLAVALTVLKIQ